MSGGYWFVAVALLTLLAIVLRPIRARLVRGRVTAGRVEADDPLIDWVVELRAAGRQTDGDGPGDLRGVERYRTGVGWPVVTGVVRRSAGTFGPMPAPPSSAAVSRASLPAPPNSPVVSRPPGWRGSRGPTRTALPGAAPATGPGRWAAGPRRTLLFTALLGAGSGGLLGGPVAAVALAGYGTLGVRALLRRGTTVRVAKARRERLDQLCALAADLRVGLPVPVAAEVLGFGGVASTVVSAAGQAVAVVGAAADGDRDGTVDGAVPVDRSPRAATPVDRPGRLAQAAIRLADRTGAPLAELVERIESDARSTERGLAAAAAQGAGARATAWLLAALPLGGIGLGYGIGVDPLQVLLHTPVGGGCAIAAVILQAIGLLWAERLAAVPGGDS
ncbi:tight adherence protein B [Micromonospora phaseoli]|uniref:Tight adherence protein B n=1 Tax=Micromonospora phaseoli TaxID=1144548 RepID=A0A1H7AVH0_9ACTN|nr:hypothetical protein [Micromonospora phaseoli]PZV96327.1 tight adherence protein B [Micromonospora phaseoli]GIJ76014.1 hypothetical protein Xph01_04460 [Micromonospora phaseoli]SEJ65850.1 tight adherence protein B [Micromonospora phaseoli]